MGLSRLVTINTLNKVERDVDSEACSRPVTCFNGRSVHFDLERIKAKNQSWKIIDSTFQWNKLQNQALRWIFPTPGKKRSRKISCKRDKMSKKHWSADVQHRSMKLASVKRAFLNNKSSKIKGLYEHILKHSSHPPVPNT